jgi:hypothetical protein
VYESVSLVFDFVIVSEALKLAMLHTNFTNALMTQNPINKIGDFPENKNVNQFCIFSPDFEKSICPPGFLSLTD